MPQAKQLPARPDLEHLKRQAKRKLASLRQRDPGAKLADAQRALAKEYGYGSWRALHRQVTSAQLVLASSAGDFEWVKMLLDQGHDVESRDQFGNTALGWTRGPRLLDILKLLLARGANPNTPAYNGHSAVGLYAYECEPAAVKLLLAYGADPNQPRESSGETPLHIAVVKDRPGRLECVRQLLRAGADPNRRAKVGPKADREGADKVRGETALHVAAQRGDAALIQVLLEAGADPTIRDADDQTPLDIASKSGNQAAAAPLRRAQRKP
jgi:ankyrin repeat protein